MILLNCSLFDGPSDYYRCERSVAADSIINQMGLAVFHFNPANHSYTVQDYNIYIFPNTLGPLDQSFVCSPSALKFLSKNNFNFNKVT